MSNVRKLRGKFEMSQGELTKKLNITKTGLINIEYGKSRNLKEKTLNKLCEIFQTTPIYILGDDNFIYKPQNDEEIDFMIEALEKMKKLNHYYENNEIKGSNKSFADYIRNLREKNHLTYEELAELCSVTHVQIRNIERGSNLPRVERLMTFAKALNVSYDEIYEEFEKVAR